MSELKQTPLFDLHIELGAKMVPFAGYEMPVQYPAGVMKEHLHTRDAAGLFDVSHMGQVRLSGADWAQVATAFERLVPQDVLGLEDGRQRYGFFTNDAGGIEDDLMFARRGDDLFVVVNAVCKAADVARMRAALEPLISVEELDGRALVALQGPGAEAALAGLCPEVRDMRFMDFRAVEIAGTTAFVSRSGYTGEDGFEISLPEAATSGVVRALLAQDAVLPIGLGARDSLRLEAGLCLYGHDIDAATTPVAAGLLWAIQKVRRQRGAREGGFPGAEVVLAAIAEGAAQRRVGLLPEGRAPMREGVTLWDAPEGGAQIGQVTSGGFGPSVEGPVAMGYVDTGLAGVDTPVWGEVRGKRLPARVAKLPFVAAGFKR